MRTHQIRRSIIAIVTTLLIAVGAAQRSSAQGTCVQGLYGVITNKLATPENQTLAQNRVLARSQLLLERGTNTLSTEVRALASVSALLGRSFRDDADVTNGLAEATSCYQGEISARLAALSAHVESLAPSSFQRVASNSVRQATQALERAATAPNAGVAFRHYMVALIRIRTGEAFADRAEFAPTAIEGKTFTVITDRPAADRGTDLVTFTDSAYTIAAHGTVPEETGTYSYNRTASNAATLVLTDAGGQTTSVDLLFKAKNVGTFTATSGDPAVATNGRFRIR